MTMTLFYTTTLASNTASVVLSAIPQTATDLFIQIHGRGTSAGNYSDAYMSINNAATNLVYQWGAGGGSGGTSSSSGNQTTGFIARLPGSAITAASYGSGLIYIPNYTSTLVKAFNTDAVYESTGSEAWQFLSSHRWFSSDPISQLTFTLTGGGSWVAGSTFSVYGITKGSGGATVA